MYRRKIVAASLCALMGMSCMVNNVSASEVSSNKEEVVYASLDQAGTVENIDIVNIFENQSSIVDYGDYSDVKVLNTTDTVDYSGGKVQITTDSDKIYYQGTLDSKILPWNISLQYELDGKTISPADLAGASGSLAIKMKITENNKYKGDFFDNYALQVVLSLDTALCKNISASGATIANVGRDQQITYTVLPGSGADIEIDTDVTDFSCDGFSINGVPLSLDVEVDETEFMDKIHELQEAISELNYGAGELSDGSSKLLNGSYSLEDGVDAVADGANELESGAKSLSDGSTELNDGSASLEDGAEELSTGVSSFQEGLIYIQTNLNLLNSNSSSLTNGSTEVKSALEQIQTALDAANTDLSKLQELSDGLTSFKDGLDELEDGASQLKDAVDYDYYYNQFADNGLDIDTVRNGNDDAISELSDIESRVADTQSKLSKLNINISYLSELDDELNNIILLLKGNNAIIDNTETYLDTIHEKEVELYDGIQLLNDKYDTLSSGVTELITSVSDMCSDLNELKEGIDTLTSKYGEMDQGIKDYTDAVGQLTEGYELLASQYSQIVDGSQRLVIGTQNLYSGTTQLLTGISQLYDGTGSLYDGSGQLKDGVVELVTNLEVLASGAGTLSEGTETLNSETENMDTTISDSINSILDSFTGDGSSCGSFVSDKNTSVKSVQFVLKTPEIKSLDNSDEAESSVGVQEESSSKSQIEYFVDKLQNLFIF